VHLRPGELVAVVCPPRVVDSARRAPSVVGAATLAGR